MIISNKIVTENRRRSRRGRQRRVGLRQIDRVAFGRRRSGTTRARGQTAFDAVEEKFVVIVVAVAGRVVQVA